MAIIPSHHVCKQDSLLSQEQPVKIKDYAKRRCQSESL
jgi:hypothetical protein